MMVSDSVENKPKQRMAIPARWPTGKPAPLAANEIQVWLADLRQPVERLAQLTATLSAEEQERAMRFGLAELRDLFIAGRGLLRELLAVYLNQPAATLQFRQGLQGKPLLAGGGGNNDLHFNVSHSADWALYAVARCPVGIDLECMDRMTNPVAIAERICTPREWAAFQAMPTEQLHSAFFTCWTRKEAIAKALGGGLACGLRTLEVCFPADEFAESRVNLRDKQGQQWSVLNLPLGPGWSGALAAAGMDWHWRGRGWA
jgi:4'-phosphopantetheinyl transferase